MFKKKQARFSVSIPYELRENKLWIKPIAWPDQCPCCNEKDSAALGTYKFEYKARYSRISSGTQEKATFFPLEWEVPYCLKCQDHMKTAENWKFGIIAICMFVPLILVLAIDASSTVLALSLYTLFILGGLALYKIVIETVVKQKQNPTCQDYNVVFWASSPPTDEHKIVFNFDTEEYARTFAALNSAELENNAG